MPCFHLDGAWHVPRPDQAAVQLSAEDPGAGQVASRVSGQDPHAEEQAGGQAYRFRIVHRHPQSDPALCERLHELSSGLWDRLPAVDDRESLGAIVLDILWFCHNPHFVLKGTEDMVSDYHDYWFHIKGFFIGEALALVVCALAGLAVQFVIR